MATVTNWIDHLNKPADQVAGAVYPGAGSSEGLRNWKDWRGKDMVQTTTKAILLIGNLK